MTTRRGSTIGFDMRYLGVEKLQAALNDRSIVAMPLEQLFKEAGKIAQDEAARAAEGGTGQWATFMKTRAVGPFVNPLSMRYGVLRHLPVPLRMTAAKIERGRKRRMGAPWFALVNWLHGSVRARSRRTALSGEDTARVALIAQSIHRGGTKGRFFMRSARDKVAQTMPRLLSDMAGNVQQRFLRRAR